MMCRPSAAVLAIPELLVRILEHVYVVDAPHRRLFSIKSCMLVSRFWFSVALPILKHKYGTDIRNKRTLWQALPPRKTVQDPLNIETLPPMPTHRQLDNEDDGDGDNHGIACFIHGHFISSIVWNVFKVRISEDDRVTTKNSYEQGLQLAQNMLLDDIHEFATTVPAGTTTKTTATESLTPDNNNKNNNNIILNNNHNNNNGNISMSKRNPNPRIKSLSLICNSNALADFFQELFSLLPGLTDLWLDLTWHTSEQVNISWVKILNQCSKLTRLTLQHGVFLHGIDTFVSESMPMWSRLQTLSIDRSTEFELLELIKFTPNLEDLTLTGVFVVAWPTIKAIVSSNIDDENNYSEDNDGDHYNSSNINNNSNSIDMNNLIDKFVSQLNQACPKLKRFMMAIPDISPQNMGELLPTELAIRLKNPRLECLGQIDCNPKFFSTILENHLFPRLTELDLVRKSSRHHHEEDGKILHRFLSTGAIFLRHLYASDVILRTKDMSIMSQHHHDDGDDQDQDPNTNSDDETDFEPWVCLGLQTLCISIQPLPRFGSQKQFYRHLARLTQLRTLHLNRSTLFLTNLAGMQEMIQNLTLMKSFKTLRFLYPEPSIEMVKEMLTDWKQLEVLHFMHCPRYAKDRILQQQIELARQDVDLVVS